MNNSRRERLRSVVVSLERSAAIIDKVLDEEKDSLDNTPGNLEGSEQYTNMEDAVDSLDSAVSDIENAIEEIKSILNP